MIGKIFEIIGVAFTSVIFVSLIFGIVGGIKEYRKEKNKRKENKSERGEASTPSEIKMDITPFIFPDMSIGDLLVKSESNLVFTHELQQKLYDEQQKRIDLLRDRIDFALELHDKDEFMKLTNELKQLKK